MSFLACSRDIMTARRLPNYNPNARSSVTRKNAVGQAIGGAHSLSTLAFVPTLSRLALKPRSKVAFGLFLGTSGVVGLLVAQELSVRRAATDAGIELSSIKPPR